MQAEIFPGKFRVYRQFLITKYLRLLLFVMFDSWYSYEMEVYKTFLKHDLS